jgi:AcrR family transcriptional regulator
MDNFSTTLEKYKTKNIENILKTSLTLFSQKGIQKVSFNEIAGKSNIGVASLYRYFKNKKTLICECAIYNLSKLIEEINPKVTSIQFLDKTAIEELEELFSYYISLFNENTAFLKFLSEFDTYINFNKMDKEVEDTYNKLYKSLYILAKRIYRKGLSDNSIRDDFDFDKFYYSISSSLFQTCIKGAVTPSIIPLDNLISTQEKLQTQINMAIYYCKKEL